MDALDPCRDPIGISVSPRNVFFLEKMGFALDLKEARNRHKEVGRHVEIFSLMSEGVKKWQQGKGTKRSSIWKEQVPLVTEGVQSEMLS